MKRFRSPLVMLLIAAFLAACGRAPIPAVSDADFATITLSADVLAQLAPQGVPMSEEGASVVEYLEVAVLDMNGAPVLFDAENTFDPEGTTSRLILGADTSSVTLRLPTAEEYTFQAWGYDNQEGMLLAYGETLSTITHQTSIIKLNVSTLLGNVALKPAAPLHYIVPGQVLDLYLDVRTVDGSYLVPIKDFEATYELDANMGSLVSGSELGARIEVASSAPADDFVVSVSVHGWTQELATGLSTSAALRSGPAVEGSITGSFTLPFLQATGATFDLEAPSLTFDSPSSGIAGKDIILSGTADDGVGIDRVRVYEGPVLIGSSAADEYPTNGVARILFDGTSWNMTWAASDGSYGLKAIAIDTSGNQTEATAGATVSTPAPVVSEGPTLAGGVNHSLALDTNGTVVAWGDNNNGQIDVPADLSSVVAVDAGDDHSLALKSDGTVVAWGSDVYGQVTVPEGLSGVVAISTGADYNLALKSDGTVVHWGYANNGSTVPSDLEQVTAIAAGHYSHSLGLKSDGTVVAWGHDRFGETEVPADLSDVEAIAAGLAHSLALKSDGTVVAWGAVGDLNDYGQAEVPADLSGVVAIAAGKNHSLALKGDGTVVAWGLNYSGQADVPTDLTDVVAISNGSNYSLALKSDGTVVGWGYNHVDYNQTTAPDGLLVQVP